MQHLAHQNLRVDSNSNISDTVKITQNEGRATAEHTTQALDQIKDKLKSTVDFIQKTTKDIEQNTNTVEEAKVAAKDAIEVAKATLKIMKDIKNKATPQQTNGPLSYAAVAAGGLPLAGTYNTQNRKALTVQTQREVIMNIRDPLTV